MATQGPTSTPSAQWSRVWEGSRWMPFNWANTSQYDLNPAGVSGALYVWSYLVANTPGGADAASGVVSGTLTVYLQFRGQR